MKPDKAFHTDAFTRGGQVFSHEWRMRLQNLRIVVLLSLIFGIVGFTLAAWNLNLSFWQCWDFWLLSYIGGYFKIWSWPIWKQVLMSFHLSLTTFLPGSAGYKSAYTQAYELYTTLSLPQGKLISVRTVQFLVHPWVKEQAAQVHQALWGSFGMWCAGMIGVILGFRRKSRRIEKRRILAGKTLETVNVVARAVRALGRPNLILAPSLPLVKNAETQHLMFVGSTGSGKTTALNELIYQARTQGQSAILCVPSCGFVNRFYNPETDIILNPFDIRSHCWDLWKDCKTTADFDQFAASLIPAPKGGQNSFWHTNAREIISATAEKLALEGHPSLQKLVEYASWKTLKEVGPFFKNSPVEALMNGTGRAEETVHSIRGQMTAAMKRLAILPQDGQSFSFYDWVKKDTSSFLFINCEENDRSTVGPLMQFWMSLAIKALLARGENPHYRLWFFMDELLGLEGGAVTNLRDLLREGRKYGGCAVLGFQNLSGLEEVYGVLGMREIASNCKTKVILNTPEPHSAHYLAQFLGEQEVLESTESFSMGAHHMRDGVNMGSQRQTRPIVTKTEIMNLKDLEAYVALPQGLPVCKVKYKVNPLPFKWHQAEFRREISLLPLIEAQRRESTLVEPALSPVQADEPSFRQIL